MPTLPYARTALEPVVSASTIDYHYGKHHAGYVAKLLEQIQGSELNDLPLPQVARITWKAGNLPVFNNAAQAWNHEFYWASLSPEATAPAGLIASLIERDFGDLGKLQTALTEAAMKQFGSGWVWLTLDNDRLRVVTTANADSPLIYPRQIPLLTIDLWEHAYYLDYYNDRKRYVESLVQRCLNWEHANLQLQAGATETGKHTGSELNQLAGTA